MSTISQRLGPVVLVAGVVALLVALSERPDLLGRAWYDGDRDCVGLTGSPDARLDACLADLRRPAVSDALAFRLQEVARTGRVAGIAPGTLAGVPLLPIGEIDGLRAQVMGTDEGAAADLLRAKGVTALVVPRDLVQALDRDAVVLSRLAHHDHLDHFQLLDASEQTFLYAVRPEHRRIDPAVGTALVHGLRARLEGRAPEAVGWSPEFVRLLAGVRLQGRLLAVRHVLGNGTEAALDDAAQRLRVEWERRVEIDGLGRLDDRLEDLRIEIWVVDELAHVGVRGSDALAELWEMGIDGAILRRPTGRGVDDLLYLPGSEAVARSIRTADEFLAETARDTRWGVRPWETDPSVQIDLMRDQHFAEVTPAGEVRPRFRGVPEVPLDAIDDRAAARMLIEGAEWWLHNQYPDGSFEYKVWPAQNRRSIEYNEVRHTLGIRDLAVAYQYRRDPRYLEGSRKAMDWLIRYQVQDTDAPAAGFPHPQAGGLLFRYPTIEEAARTATQPNQKLGTVAVALLGWVAWAEITGSHEEDWRIRKMAEFTRSMLDADGRFVPYYVAPGHPYAEQRNDIVPGEAALALARVAEWFGEPEWVAFYPKFLGYYQPWFRERAARARPDGRWPHDTYENQDRLDLVQFGPWSVMAARHVWQVTRDPEAAAFGLEVADWMIDNYAWSSERSPWPDYVGGYYKLPHELPAMQSFCYSEGTAAAWALAALAAPERTGKYAKATRESMRFLEVMQFDPDDSAFLSRPEVVRGGVKYAMNENKVRIDYVGHGLSTAAMFLEARAIEGGLDLPDPEGWAAVPVRLDAASASGAHDVVGDDEGE